MIATENKVQKVELVTIGDGVGVLFSPETLARLGVKLAAPAGGVTMDDPVWLTIELALDVHQRQLAIHGGQDGVRDMGLLESAIGRPRHLFAYEPCA